MPPARHITGQEAVFSMTHENPWFLITGKELLTIYEGLHSLEPEIPAAGSQQLIKILSTLNMVRDRKP